MNAKDKQLFVDKPYVVKEHDAQPHLYITSLVHSCIEEPESAKDFFANQGRRWLGDTALIQPSIKMLNEQVAAVIDLADIIKSQVRVGVVGQELARQVRGSIGFYDQVTACEDEAQLRLSREQLHHPLSAFRIKGIILEKKLDELALRLAHAFIPVSGQSLLRLIDDQSNAIVFQ